MVVSGIRGPDPKDLLDLPGDPGVTLRLRRHRTHELPARPPLLVVDALDSLRVEVVTEGHDELWFPLLRPVRHRRRHLRAAKHLDFQAGVAPAGFTSHCADSCCCPFIAQL